MSRLRTTASLVALVWVAFASGCGPAKGTVSGTVTFDNKPLPGGVVTFQTEGRNPYSAQIGADGHYELTLPAGTYQIAVDNHELEARGKKAPPPQAPPGVKLAPPPKVDTPRDKTTSLAGQYVRIPEKYQSATSSGLSCTVTGGAQDHPIQLK